MKNSKQLRNLKEELLNEIYSTLKELIHTIECKYIEETGTMNPPVGYIQLSGSLVHFEHDSDGSLNEVITGIHTLNPLIQTDTQGSASDYDYVNISDWNLISIIAELEGMIRNPDTIEINEEN